MTIALPADARPHGGTRTLFAGAIFISAALVFALEPMIAKMILPLLGGSPAVWNTSMLFFQVALLIGYLYAHLLQRFLAVRQQIACHLLVLAASALSLPLSVSNAFGPPPAAAPVWWLLGVLLASIGAPFTALSATTPLLQAWFVKTRQGTDQSRNPYALYVASNLGSMLALLAYPTLAEPLMPLSGQSRSWAIVYGLFFLVIFLVAITTGRKGTFDPTPAKHAAAPISGRQRLIWILLAAGPSSLMLGTTTYIANDVASVPLFWVIPLALYLVTFIIAFQDKPAIPRAMALRWQALFAVLAACVLCVTSTTLPVHLLVFLGATFFGALICHHALAAGRPDESRLTEFYLLIAMGGVVGGIFNSLLAPIIFPDVYEFPLVLTLVCLARPWSPAGITRREAALTFAGLGLALAIALSPAITDPAKQPFLLALVIAGGIVAALVSRRGLLFTVLIGALCAQGLLADKHKTLLTSRSFFGVSRVTAEPERLLGGNLHVLYHGTTVHGAQAENPRFACRPLTYYSQAEPIGQIFTALQRQKSALHYGIVGLGAGTLAVYRRAADRMRYFEIDPEVARIAQDPRYFSYLSRCAAGKVDIVLGDARLTLARETAGSYDFMLLDAFSSDNIPTHLLTREALSLYIRALKPGGVVALHISNRNLALEAPAAATAKSLGLAAMTQRYAPPPGLPGLMAPGSEVMLLARSPGDLTVFAASGKWQAADGRDARAWSDDYTNVVQALMARVIFHR